MKQFVHDRLLRWGFSLAFLAMLGGLVIWVNPPLEEVRGAIILGALLPTATIGVGLIAIAKVDSDVRVREMLFSYIYDALMYVVHDDLGGRTGL